MSWRTWITKEPPSLVYPMSWAFQAPATNWLNEALSSLALWITQFSPIASTKKWILPILPNSTKTSLYTQDGCGKCLGYQLLKDLEMERYELTKTTMDCVENYGYDNLSLSRVMVRVFSLKSTPHNSWLMRVYIVWIKNLIKQHNFFPNRQFCKLALLAKHSQNS